MSYHMNSDSIDISRTETEEEELEPLPIGSYDSDETSGGKQYLTRIPTPRKKLLDVQATDGILNTVTDEKETNRG
jgi:hypothetical protein